MLLGVCCVLCAVCWMVWGAGCVLDGVGYEVQCSLVDFPLREGVSQVHGVLS